MPTIAVTGATGFVGRAVIHRLLQDHPTENIRVLVRNPNRRRLPDNFKSLKIVDGDLDTKTALQQLITGANAVIHIAAATTGNSFQDFMQINRDGTHHVLSAMRLHAPEGHIIHLSSLAAREPELSWYTQSKSEAEQVIHDHRIAYSILRPPAVYGPEDVALANLWRWLARGWLFRLSPASARFSLLHVDDLAETVARLIEHGPTERVLTLHDGHESNGKPGWDWNSLADTAETIGGRKIHTLAIPSSLLAGIAQLNLARARRRGKPAMLTPGKHRELIHPDWVCDNQAVKTTLDWQPTTSLTQSLGNLPGWKQRQ